MRPAQKSNRSRGRGNRKSNGGGGGNSLNRVYDSAGPEGKVRGTPAQIIEKYLSLARDAQTSGDRVTSENFLQHAEHYQRIVIQATTAQEQARKENEASQAQPQQQPQPQQVAAAAQPAEAASDTGPAATGGDGAAKTDASAPQQGGDIGGMAMIDAEPIQGSLIVEDAKAPAQKDAPRKANGGGRNRRKKPPAEDVPVAAAPDAGEAQHDS